MRRATDDLSPIIVKGNQFVLKTTGERFLARAVIYYNFADENYDGLLIEEVCRADIFGLVDLGVNVIVVSIVDMSKDRANCVKRFQAAGIYLLVVFSWEARVYQADLAWDSDVYQYHTALVDSLSPHSNILGFVFIIDVPITNSTSDSLAFTKARIRDVKAYIKSNNYRQTPIGIVEFGDDSRSSTAQFLRCRTPASNEGLADFWLLTDRFDCPGFKLDPPDTTLKNRSETFRDYGIPLLSIGGTCGTAISGTRNFSWVASLFSPPVSSVWSGGIFDDWYTNADGTGLVNMTIGDDGQPTLNKSAAFTTLSSQINAVTSSPTQVSIYSPTISKPSSCPTIDAGFRASTNLPPQPNLQLCGCMMSSLYCVVPEAIPVSTVPKLMAAACSNDSTNCIGVATNGTTGVYGAYSGCNLYQQYSWALNRLAINHADMREPVNCSFSSWGRTQTRSISATCSPMLLQAGVLGDGTVGLQTTSPTSSSRSSIFTSGSDSSNQRSSGSTSELSDGVIAGIVVGIAILTCFIIGSILLWHRRKYPNSSFWSSPSAEGLEVGEAPPGLGHNAELGGEGAKSEMWTKGNTSELPTSIPLHALSDGTVIQKSSSPKPQERGEYAAVPRIDPEVEDLDGTSRSEEDVVLGKGIRRKPLASEISSSWAGAAWFDPNDPRQVLPGGRAASPDPRGE